MTTIGRLVRLLGTPEDIRNGRRAILAGGWPKLQRYPTARAIVADALQQSTEPFGDMLLLMPPAEFAVPAHLLQNRFLDQVRPHGLAWTHAPPTPLRVRTNVIAIGAALPPHLAENHIRLTSLTPKQPFQQCSLSGHLCRGQPLACELVVHFAK